MKKIVMIRHAKSSWTADVKSDKLRPLNSRGQRDAPFMAQRLKEIVPHIGHLAVSSATRTQETARAFIQHYQSDIEAMAMYDSLYHGTLDDYEAVLYGLPDSLHTVAMIGHNPTMTEMANAAHHSHLIDNVPTCGIYVLETACERWVDVSVAACHRTDFLFPKQTA